MKTYSLLDILSSEITIEDGKKSRQIRFEGIRIPMIQRDYAHGRKNESLVRTRFLDNLFRAMAASEILELDFIYGSVQSFSSHLDGAEKTVSYFVPLDGQQRLMSLFLLYWYIGNKENGQHEKEQLRETLKRFSYATRASSARFCEQLCRMDPGDDPANRIEQSIWFHDGFRQDPTVRSMLHMIREIQRYYNKQNGRQLYAALEKLRFYVLPLDGFDLSDELYIKMNGRGKQLTDFENLKADLVNWMREHRECDQHAFAESVNYQGHLIPYHLMISAKIDNEWSGIFWKDALAQAEEEHRIVDPAFMRFLLRLMLTRYIAGMKQAFPCSIPVHFSFSLTSLSFATTDLRPLKGYSNRSALFRKWSPSWTGTIRQPDRSLS